MISSDCDGFLVNFSRFMLFHSVNGGRSFLCMKFVVPVVESLGFPLKSLNDTSVTLYAINSSSTADIRSPQTESIGHDLLSQLQHL